MHHSLPLTLKWLQDSEFIYFHLCLPNACRSAQHIVGAQYNLSERMKRWTRSRATNGNRFPVEAGEEWGLLDELGHRCHRAFLAPIQNCRKGYLFEAAESGSLTPTSRRPFVSKSSIILCIWFCSFYLYPGKKQVGRCYERLTNKPAWTGVCYGSSVASSHLNNQEKTVFQPQWHQGMTWNHVSTFSLLLVTH